MVCLMSGAPSYSNFRRVDQFTGSGLSSQSTLANPPAFAHSFKQGRVISHEVTTHVADGMASRTPDAAALAIAKRGAERVVQVSDGEVESAMRALFADTHNTAEGGGAAAFAALLQEKDKMRGRKTAVVLSGGNVDSPLFSRILARV